MSDEALLVQGGRAAIEALSMYHPVVIEGMGRNDPRPASQVADNIIQLLHRHWSNNHHHHQASSNKPKLVVIQGDPLHERGISAITLIVAEKLNVSRGLVCLDDAISHNHSRNADRTNVVVECRYSDLVQALPAEQFRQLEALVNQMMHEKNQTRQSLGEPLLGKSCRHYALLQEVTKAACRHICGELTVTHTHKEVGEFTVRSFYKAGLQLGLVDEETDVVYYDFDD